MSNPGPASSTNAVITPQLEFGPAAATYVPSRCSFDYPRDLNALPSLNSFLQTSSVMRNGTVEIVLPAGDFTISGTFDFTAGRSCMVSASGDSDSLAGVVLKGAGRERTRIFCMDSGVKFRFYSTTGQSLYTHLSGFSLIGPGNIMDSNSVGIQFGGVQTTRSNILSDSIVENVLIRGFHACTRHDDNTNFNFRNCFFQDFMWGSQLAYNCDIFRFTNCSWGDQGLGADGTITVSCNTTNGSPIITGINSVTLQKMKPGQWISGANIPANSIITAVGNTSITLNNNASATGATTIEMSQGIAVATQGDESGTYRPSAASLASNGALTAAQSQWIPPFNTLAGNQNSIVFDSCWFMRLRSSGMYQPTTTSQVKYDSCYTERGYRVLDVGITSASNPAKNISIINHHFSQASAYRYGGVIDYSDNGSSNAVFELRMCRSEEAPAGASWLRIGGNITSGGIYWDRNDLVAPSSGNTWSVTSSSVTSPNSQSIVVIAFRAEGNYVRAYNGATDGNSISWDALGIDGIQYALTANSTLNNPSTDASSFKRIRLNFIQDATGGRSITFGSKFVTSAGVALGTIAGGTSNQRLLLEVIYDGNGHYIAQTTPTWM